MTNRATYLSQDALLLRNNFLNLVVDGIKTQLSDQPINDHTSQDQISVGDSGGDIFIDKH